MTYSSQLIALLKSKYPDCIPLDEIGRTLTLKQTDTSDLIADLVEKGYPLNQSKEGIRFELPLINSDSIKADLRTRRIGRNLIFKDRIPSTNELALNKLNSFSHGDIILTDFQTNGKGRMGRNWQASLGKSIALSIVLKPAIENEQAVLLTQLTAAALSKAIDQITHSSIKWPNDMIVNSKKVAGILTESHFSGSSLEGIVIGVGINTNMSTEDIDNDLRSKATSLLIETQIIVDPNSLITSFIQWFDELYSSWELTNDSSPFISICKEKSILMNREIIVRIGEMNRPGKVVDINPLGELIIKYAGQDSLESLQTMDFSIRGKDSYI